MTAVADRVPTGSVADQPRRWLTVRRTRWLVAALALVVGVADLVITAAHGRPIPHGHRLSSRLVADVLGAQYLLPTVGVALVWLSRGLLHAKRNAWIVATASAVASIVAGRAHHQDLLGVVPGVVLLTALVLTRRSFRAPHDPARVRDALRLLVVGGLVVFVYGVLGLYLLDSQFVASTTVFGAGVDAVRSMVLLGPHRVDPASVHGRWLLESIRVGALIVTLTAAARLLLTFARPRLRSERRVVSELLDRWAVTPLAPFHLLDDKAWFVTADRTSFVGYALVGNVAVALGEPIGPPERCADAAREFCELCQLNGWIPAFHQVSVAGADALATMPLKIVKIGEEAIVPVETWTIDDPDHKSLRSALRRVERAGYETVELPSPIDAITLAELRVVSDRWLADGNHRERTFTVGRFDTEAMRVSTVMAVRQRETGRIVAFANVLPSYHSPDGNFDLMRRDPDAPNGVMEHLFVALIRRFRDEGLRGMTLGLAPMANITGDTIPDRAMRLVYEHGNGLFNYQGLRRFKEKWQPRWEPRYLAYRSDADLPKVAIAVARAGELPDPGARLTHIRNVARRLPGTLTIGALVIYFMAVTNGAPALHHDLLRHIGLAWRDLVHLQLWRLPASQLAETTAGFVWGNVALLLLVLPIAEWRLGTRRTVLVFFLGDWASTVPTLVGMRIASHWSASAEQVIRMRDAGPSSGAWALALTVALTIRNPKLRLGLSAALFAFLVSMLVVHRRLFDVQHVLSALAAAAGVAWVAWSARRSAHPERR